jgi:hypothetical protein
MTIDDANLAELRRIAGTLLDRTQLVYTTEEAISFTKVGSDAAFYRWARTWKVSRLSNGRYAREHLEAGLAREAARIRVRSTRRRPNAPTPASRLQTPASQPA